MNSLFTHRELIWIFTKRNLIGRYKGSFLGILWSFINPLFMLSIYTVVFSKILQVRFGASGSHSLYALYLYCGLIPWLAFSETIGHSTSLISENTNLVKKTIFPLEILPVASTLTGFIHSIFGLSILMGGILIIGNHFINPTVFLLPLVMIPQILVTLGLAWFFSSISVFIRDMGEGIRIGLTAWMFLTPIFYPVETIPVRFRFVLYLNPMAVIVEGYRDLLLNGTFPDWIGLSLVFFVGSILSLSGLLWFRRTKKVFADVI